jgi:hypothetical protein
MVKQMNGSRAIVRQHAGLVWALASSGAVGVVCLALGPVAHADTGTGNNPYQGIAVRNAFDLRPPPPPVTAPVTNTPPEAAKTDLKFTGISKIAGVKRAHLASPDTKNPGRFIYYDIEERVTQDGIEVLEIDEGKESVRLRSGSQEMLLTFEKHGLKGPPPAAAGGQPGTALPGGLPPTVPGGGRTPAASGANPITTAGGFGNQPAQPIIAGRNYAYNPAATGGSGGTPTTSVGTSAGYAAPGTTTAPGTPAPVRTIPSRQLRTVPPAPEASNLSAEQQAIIMEAQRMRAAERGIEMPPTPGLPPELPPGTSP